MVLILSQTKPFLADDTVRSVSVSVKEPSYHQICLDEKFPTSSSIGAGSTSRESSITTLLAPAEHDEPESVVLIKSELFSTQKMFWSAFTLFEDKTSLNFSALCSIEGHVDIDKLERALRDLGEQHEALRTCFVDHNGMILQRIMKESAIRLEFEWVDGQLLLNPILQRIRQQKFKAKIGELVKLILVSTSPTTHFFDFGASHLCMHGISVRIFLVDLFRHYLRQVPQQPTIQFREYAEVRQAELETGRLDHELDFWKVQYPDFPPLLPILRISRSTLRPKLASFKSATVEANISLDIKHRVTSICRQCRVTPFHFYLSVFRVLIARLSDIDDISVRFSMF